MSFEGLAYDSCTYKENLAQSLGAGDYVFNTPLQDCNRCFSLNPMIRQQTAGGTMCEGSLIDVDSEMMNITRKASSCSAMKYDPRKNDSKLCPSPRFNACDRGIETVDTRMNDPPSTLRGSGWNRWEWLCTNPQQHFEMPFEHNINNRIVVKDNHRPLIEDPVSQLPALPVPIDKPHDVVVFSPAAICKGGENTRTVSPSHMTYNR
jgi:hypothetical protein